MTQAPAVPVTRRHAAVAAALSGTALVVVGYASGWGLSLPVAGSVVAQPAPVRRPAATQVVTVPVSSIPVPARHYVASGPVVVPPAPSSSTGGPTDPPPASGGPSGGPSGGTSGGPGGSGGPGTGHTPGQDCTGLEPALRVLVQHLDAGHLEESPAQQVADILDLGHYTTTHTTLLAGLLQPLLGGVTDDLQVLVQHIDAGHLEESPAQQVQDLLSTDQYVRTHTVLIENLLKPIVGDGSC